jgi:hypothetical protein
MARFVLVHGAWHGGWCWEPLSDELRSRGHRVEAPDLPCEDVTKTQADYASLIGRVPDAVVVGHSLGGLTAALVEARLRVYLAAILPVEDAFTRCRVPSFGGAERDGHSHGRNTRRPRPGRHRLERNPEREVLRLLHAEPPKP